MFGNSIYAVYGKMLNVLSLPDYFLMEFNLSTCVISFLFFFLFFFSVNCKIFLFWSITVLCMS